MKVLIDTSVWSTALRKKNLTSKDERIIEELKELIAELRVQIIGPIRQELLSGISDKEKYAELKEHLRAFDDIPLETIDYEEAARYYNTCRRKGIQGSHIDYLICAISTRNDLSIFSEDKDFRYYQKHLPIKLYEMRKR